MAFGLSFMILYLYEFYGSVAPTRSSTSYAYFITKIGNRNLNLADFTIIHSWLD